MLQIALGVKEEEIKFQNAATIGELLTLLAQKYGDVFRITVLKRNGSLRPLAKVFLSDKNIMELKGMNTALEADSEVCIFIEVEAPAGGN